MKNNIYWNLYAELRKEIIESQKIRAQVIGFKITFVSASIGLLSSHYEKIPNSLFVMPAFASIFFDFLISSYSFSIKRIGFYLREYLEPNIMADNKIPSNFVFWQSFLQHPKTRQSLSLIGNYGITLLAGFVGILTQFYPL